MSHSRGKAKARKRRFFSEEFKQEAVQMLLDGHPAPSVAERLGLAGPNVLYRWKKDALRRASPAARSLGERVVPLEEELRRVERERDIFKKCVSHLKPPGVADVYALIEQLTLEGAFPLAALCDVLEFCRAGYYAWQSAAESARQQRDRELMPLICDIFWNHKRRYRARRIAVELAARGQPCGVDCVAKLLKIQGLKAIQPQPYRPRTTNSRHSRCAAARDSRSAAAAEPDPSQRSRRAVCRPGLTSPTTTPTADTPPSITSARSPSKRS